jgi:hypothetical protein
LYSSPDIIRDIKSRRLWKAGNVALMGKMRNPYRHLVGKPETKKPLGRPRHRCENSIKMGLKQDMDWIHLPQDRDHWWAVVKTVMNNRIP